MTASPGVMLCFCATRMVSSAARYSFLKTSYYLPILDCLCGSGQEIEMLVDSVRFLHTIVSQVTARSVGNTYLSNLSTNGYSHDDHLVYKTCFFLADLSCQDV